MILGHMIMVLRVRKKLNKKELLKKMNRPCSASYLVHVEQGKTIPSLKFLVKLSCVLETDLDELIVWAKQDHLEIYKAKIDKKYVPTKEITCKKK